jgi:peroxiredoxin Q/BCP
VSVAVNEIAPDFVLPGIDGTPVQLSALRGRKVVLFFYPRDESPVCVVQVCAFRDAYEELTSAGVEVVGISSDSPESHHAFAAHRSLPFPILSDAGGAVRRRYGAGSPLLFGATGRVTYLIDEEGVVRDIFSSMFRPVEHVRRARAWVGAADP